MSLDTSPTWDQYRIHLVKEMERLADSVDHLADRIDAIDKTVEKQGATAQERAKWTGALWGGMVSAAVIAARIFFDVIFKTK